MRLNEYGINIKIIPSLYHPMHFIIPELDDLISKEYKYPCRLFGIAFYCHGKEFNRFYIEDNMCLLLGVSTDVRNITFRDLIYIYQQTCIDNTIDVNTAEYLRMSQIEQPPEYLIFEIECLKKFKKYKV